MIECKICGNMLTEYSMKVHTKKQHGLTYNEYRLKFGEIGPNKCLCCGKNIEHLHYNTQFCNRRCKDVYKKNLKYENIKDIPVCKICGMKGMNLISHINRRHGMSLKEYKKKYNTNKSDVFHTSYLDKIKMFGKDNPAYNHGGKYSPFSKNFIHYTNEEDRKKALKNIAKNRSYNTRTDYWIKKGYTEKEAKKMVSKRQTTFSKKICIEKHGEKEGLKVWKERQEKWQNTMKSKPPKEIERINRNKISSGYNISKNEYKIVDRLKNFLPKHQFTIFPKGYVYDIKVGNKLIEYNGDYWHCNPEMYSENYYNKRLKMTSKQKWNKDKIRIDYAKENGYDVMVIWEKNYKSNPDKEIERCLEFING